MATMASMREAQTARQNLQCGGMRMWLEEREVKWGTHNEDDILWCLGVTDRITNAIAGMQLG